jgi:DNA polymerase (family 10)
MLDKLSVANALREVGMLLELKGENPFKVRAYENGARAVEGLTEDLATLVDEGRLTDVPGIGKALAEKIAHLHATGHLPLLEELRAELPPGFPELLRIPDLGPKKIAALRGALGVSNVAELKAACEAGRVREVKGFGERTEHKILEGIRALEARPRRTLLSEAREAGEPLLAWLRESGLAERVELAGSARRWKETVGDLDVVAASTLPEALSERLAAYPLVEQVQARGTTKTRVQLVGGLGVDLRVVPPEDWATLLHHLTGSKAHHVKLRGLARDRGYTLSEWGLSRLGTGEKVQVRREEDIYRALGMQAVPPELREDEGEIEAALEHALPKDLVDEGALRGMVHVHTAWSDGRAPLEEMARAAEAMGMQYLTVTDHSAAAAYARGLDARRLEEQWEEMARVQEKVRIRLLRGTEADILEDGSLDVPERLLGKLDVIIASVHSRMRMDADRMTHRIAAAMRLPFFKIWGHASGRLLLERAAYGLHWEEVLDAIAGSPAAIEVNGDPHRLDLEPRWLRKARERDIRFVLSTDAHSVAGLQNLRYAVMTARRGWVTRGEVLNAMPPSAFADAVRPTR